MCARFTLFAPVERILDNYHLLEISEVVPRFNIAPSQSVLAIGVRGDGSSLGATFFQWGLVPYWAADPNGPRPVNAKAETLTEKPMFRESFRKRRCVIPATGYYEWRTEGKKKIPLFIRRKDLGLMSFAGIWDCWKRGTEKLMTCAIITTESNELTRSIHDRMPALLSEPDQSAWLNPNTSESDRLRLLLKPYPAELLEIVPANPFVNNSRHEGPDCLTAP